MSTQRKKRAARPARRGKRHREPAPGPRIGRGKLWLFRCLAATLIPLILLLLVEWGLRVGGYGHPTRPAIKDEIGDRRVYRNNSQFTWLFFPREIARTSTPYVFDAEKADNCCRIFILGASAAQGIPEPAFAFGRMLQAMLREKYPGIAFEVINTAIVATNSHVVRKIAADCARHEPDLFVVYLGNNEVIGPYGPGTVLTPLSDKLTAIRLGIVLKGARIGQLFSNALGRTRPAEPAAWTGMEMFLEHQVRHDHPSLQTVYAHFMRNLEDIRDAAVRSNAGIVFSSVGDNLGDSPPFASLFRTDITETETASWRERYDQGVAHEEKGAFEPAIAEYVAAAAIDETFADLQYRLATCYRKLGDLDRAGPHYLKAREYDALRFRADDRINQVIRSVAGAEAGEGIRFADAAGALREASPHGITGRTLFHEHVHLNFSGNYVVARAILEQVEPLLSERVTSRRNPAARTLTEEACRRRLVYTQKDEFAAATEILNSFVKRPPFTLQLYHELDVQRREERLEGLKQELMATDLKQIDAQFKEALAAPPRDWMLHERYGQFLLEGLGDAKAAVTQFLIVQDRLPHHASVYAHLGESLGRLGNLDAAIALNLKAIGLAPSYATAHFNLGLAYHMRGNRAKAIEHYEAAIRHQPFLGNAHNNRAVILLETGRVDEAMDAYRKAQEVVPGFSDLYYNLGRIYQRQGRPTDAAREYREALQINPDSAKLRQALQSVSGEE